MTENEAIETLKSDKMLYETENCHSGDGSPDGDLIQALDMAIQALEKQIPKKPMISYDERVKENWCSCGVCAFGLGWKRTIHYKYCPDCGQKLDWE